MKKLICTAGHEFELEDDDYDDIDTFDHEEFFDCGLVGNTGLCLKAGSEECDWDCPYNHLMRG